MKTKIKITISTNQMFWQFLVNVKTIYATMSLELGHYKWCHTGYHYTHHSQAIVLVVWHHPSSRTREPLRCQAWKY